MSDEEQQFLQIAVDIATDAGIDETDAALVAAVYLGIGSDSRSLSNRLGIAHALVLRGIAALDNQFIHIEKRDTRTQRTFVSLTPRGMAIAQRAAHRAGAER